MSDLWCLQLKPNDSATFTPLRTLKLTNATLGVDIAGESERTVVLLKQDPLPSGEDSSECAQAVPIFSLTAAKDEHRCLDILLTRGRKYTFHAEGPNDIHLFGYFLSAISLPDAVGRVAPHTSVNASTIASSASATTTSSATSVTSLKRKGSQSSVAESQVEKKKKTGYLIKDVHSGSESNKQAVRNSLVSVDLKATWKSSDDNIHTLFEESNVKLTLDGAKERGWKSSITGMRSGGQRLIKVPAHLATGSVESSINREFTVEVHLRRILVYHFMRQSF
ncbi:hypothetical protein FB451DRAFT_1404297 [Mycena latifolia]|nr:hypothetical protein FB451DRAFT_1404297 [Mycena latifolia]